MAGRGGRNSGGIAPWSQEHWCSWPVVSRLSFRSGGRAEPLGSYPACVNTGCNEPDGCVLYERRRSRSGRRYWSDFDGRHPLEGPARGQAWTGTVHGLFAELDVGTVTHSALQIGLALAAILAGVGVVAMLTGGGLIWASNKKQDTVKRDRVPATSGGSPRPKSGSCAPRCGRSHAPSPKEGGAPAAHPEDRTVLRGYLRRGATSTTPSRCSRLLCHQNLRSPVVPLGGSLSARGRRGGSAATSSLRRNA